MRIIPVDKLEVDMVMGEQIEVAGQIMLNRGAVLTQPYIDKLQHMGLTHVTIDDSQSQDIELETTISADTHRRGTKVVAQAFYDTQEVLESIREEVKGSAEEALEHSKFTDYMKNSPAFQAIIDYTRSLLEEILNSSGGIALNSIKQHDSRMFQHAIDVTAMAISLGRELNLPERHLEDLAYGTILHDIGKIMIPKSIISKSINDLSRQELALLRTHSLLGRRMMLNNSRISQRIRAVTVVTQHHEYHDGSGFPYGLKGSSETWSSDDTKHFSGISHLAEIANIVNTFDTLTSDHLCLAEPLGYLDAAYVMVNRLYNRFHPAYLDAFLRILTIFPPGSNIQIPSGRYQGYLGTVVRTSSEDRLSPFVRLFFDDKRNKLEVPIDLDMAAEQDVSMKRRSAADLDVLEFNLL
ncbi:HD-GYP domain-containing protein [Desulfurispira natronophila]|uniref:HD-GYP domain-containing protein (C-di-GMP phosphodiesterase class II) n=1 Tax=Desulfurispira natronophila TaxID=682562 RepID=A0A7W8DHJ6_9BACT|nr:HD domain-containing phosphohydrolase [Desulfurispira natronophila]MBB5022560.1 HD-GYP domain-containing protein (c-di-GMP phosphodiesterase class II) [Desulfurispira natronophila]